MIRTMLRTAALAVVLTAPLLWTRAPVMAAPATLALANSGVSVNAGALGAFTVNGPHLKDNAGQDVPLVSRTVKDAQTVAYTFRDDTVINVLVDDIGKTITVDYAKHALTAKTIGFDALVPFTLREGGKATFDGQTVPFPPDLKPGPDGQNIWRGAARRFEITTALGQILAIAAPQNWQQLQDNRFWNNNQTFQWMYQYDLARDPAKTSFALKFEDVAGGKPAPEVPKQIVDKFGQSKLVDFPGKVKSEDDLKTDVALDKTYYDSLQAPARDTYGGLPGSGVRLGLKQTGFFHVDKIKDAKRGELSVLVDPIGNLWFQLGLCALGGGGDSFTFVQNRTEPFEALPSPADFPTAYIDGSTSLSFYVANWTRKNGKAWNAEDFTAQTIDRVRKLGFNSSGAFSGGTKIERERNFPRVGWVDFGGIDTIPDTHGIMDPFAGGAAAQLDKNCANLADDNDDPLVIGHFLGNEQPFENIPKIVPGLDGKSGAKRRLVQMLREKYGDIAKFNTAWDMKPAAKSFDELADTKLFVVTKDASADMTVFFDLLLDTYYKTIAQSYHKNCPNHLLLGSRWLTSTANSDAVCKAAGRYLDVVSVNYYTYGLEADFLKRIHTLAGGRPILLSEWHYGATDQGLSGGARQVRDQRERGLAYRNYVEQAASLGYVVGDEWFSYLDQPLTGRWFEHDNGEKGNIGLVNVADRPYKEFLDGVTKANADVYDVLLGQKPPFRYADARFNGAQGETKKVVLIPHALPGMEINGIQEHWPGLPAERITAANMVMGTDPTGISGDFRLAWDAANLYLFIQVKDPTPMENENGVESLWASDSIELFIGSENLTQGGAMQFSDRQVLLSARKGADGYRWFFNNSPQQFPVNMIVVKNVGNDGYTLEAAIPFAGLGFTPHENQEVLFDLGLNDNTAGRRQFMWNGVARNSGDRGAWGRAKLVK